MQRFFFGEKYSLQNLAAEGLSVLFIETRRLNVYVIALHVRWRVSFGFQIQIVRRLLKNKVSPSQFPLCWIC